VGEQRARNGAAIAQSLRDIIREEDPTRYTTVGSDQAGPNDAFTGVVDIIGLNYQGGDPRNRYVSAYELYAVSWGASPEKVFAAQDRYPYVAGEFVWTGWDYLGEPTPYDLSRSSYFGIIDLAGFPKDRFYLYQSRWNPTVKMAHILPHWNWPDRKGQVTPVHVFSSGDQAELFLNGVSQGVQKKTVSSGSYRFRWGKVVYQPGELQVVTYKNGNSWTNATMRTTGEPSGLHASTYRDRKTIKADGADLSFISIAVVDQKGDVVRPSNNAITFSVQGPGEIVTTDNGDPTDMVPFPSPERKAFGGLALAIVRPKAGSSGKITVTASAKGLESAAVVEKPFPGVSRALVIAGSDKRGTIYGIHTLAEQSGQSPLHWFADVPAKKHAQIHAQPKTTIHGEPSVRYRGLFINDEEPALNTWWARQHNATRYPLDTEFYAHVFDLLLRLKANYMWPAMWKSFIAPPGNVFFKDDPGNQQLADDYG